MKTSQKGAVFTKNIPTVKMPLALLVRDPGNYTPLLDNHVNQEV